MNKKKYDLAVKIGSYTDREGKEKGKYLNIGVIIEKEDGGRFMIMNRTFNPAGVPNPENKDTFIVSMFSADRDSEPENDTPPQRAQNEPDNPFDDSEIPF